MLTVAPSTLALGQRLPIKTVILAYAALLVGKHFLDVFTRERLGTFKWRAKSPVPDELCSDAKGAGYTEEDSVELHLVKPVETTAGFIVNMRGCECRMGHTRSR